MLLDAVLPTYDFRERHALWVPAPPERVYTALQQVTPADTPLLRRLFEVRALPARLVGRRVRGYDQAEPLWDQFVAAGFPVLAAVPCEEVVVGRIGQFWRVWDAHAVPIDNAEEFRTFATPGYAKVALNVTLTRLPWGTQLATETRIGTTDPAARRLFVPYWLVFQVGSAAIRHSWLHAVKRRALASAPSEPV